MSLSTGAEGAELALGMATGRLTDDLNSNSLDRELSSEVEIEVIKESASEAVSIFSDAVSELVPNSSTASVVNSASIIGKGSGEDRSDDTARGASTGKALPLNSASR